MSFQSSVGSQHGSNDTERRHIRRLRMLIAGLLCAVSADAVAAEIKTFDELGQRSARISSSAEIPEALMQAANAYGCRISDGVLNIHPIQFFSFGPRRTMVIVPCGGAPNATAFYIGRKSSGVHPINFVIPGEQKGFEAVYYGGYLEWVPETEIMTMTTFEDQCGIGKIRKRMTYRPTEPRAHEPTGLRMLLVKIEKQQVNCENGPWHEVWTAPLWEK